MARAGGATFALLHDGRVVAVEEARLRIVRRGWQGDGLVPCAGAVLGVGRTGRLRALAAIAAPGGDAPPSVEVRATGPRVSPHATPLCLDGGRVVVPSLSGTELLLLDTSLTVEARRPLPVLPDAEPVALGPDAVAVLAEPSFRYRHGVLGDEVEPRAVVVLGAADLDEWARWEAPGPFVLEQRRPQPFAFGGRRGVLVSRAGYRARGGLLALELRRDSAATHLVPAATAASRGRRAPWIHPFAARADRAYAVRDPHGAAPVLQRYALRLPRPLLPVREARLEVTAHVLGSRELDLAVLLPRSPRDGPGVDRLLLPRRDLRALRWVRCDAHACTVEREVPLDARLAAAPVVLHEGGRREVVAADADGALYRLVAPGDPHTPRGE